MNIKQLRGAFSQTSPSLVVILLSHFIARGLLPIWWYVAVGTFYTLLFSFFYWVLGWDRRDLS